MRDCRRRVWTTMGRPGSTENIGNVATLVCLQQAVWIFFFQAEDGIRDYKVTVRRVLFRSQHHWPRGVEEPAFACRVRRNSRSLTVKIVRRANDLLRSG